MGIFIENGNKLSILSLIDQWFPLTIRDEGPRGENREFSPLAAESEFTSGRCQYLGRSSRKSYFTAGTPVS
ncbi:MAG: hypothetical protein K0Q57_487 [Gammaproteobacteria bacterium]|jgi:hypothetical protein|nr:hypothetical protein [Gammaproteobacteria bacterium]